MSVFRNAEHSMSLGMCNMWLMPLGVPQSKQRLVVRSSVVRVIGKNIFRLGNGTPLKLEQQLGKRENILAEVDAETRWMEDIGLMLTWLFVRYISWLTWSGSFALPCHSNCSSLPCHSNCSNSLSAKILKKRHEHTEGGWSTSELRKCDHLRSTWMQH